MKIQYLTPTCEEAFNRLICHLKGETPDNIPSFDESLKEFNNLKSTTGLPKIAETLKLEMATINHFENSAREVNRLILKKKLKDEYENRNGVITQLRFLIIVEQINSKIPHMVFLPVIKFPLSQEKEIVGLKKVRAIELTIRALANEKYESQEELECRIRSIINNANAVERIKTSAEFGDILSGTTFFQLIKLFVHEEEFKRYQEHFEGSPYLTYFKDRRASIRYFLNEIRVIRNLFAHNKRISDTRMYLLDLYFEELFIPIQKSFNNGKTDVNPEVYMDISGQNLSKYFKTIRENISSARTDIKEDIRLAKLDLGGSVLSAKNEILKMLLSIKDDLKTFGNEITEDVEAAINRYMAEERTGWDPAERQDRRNKLILAKRVNENWINRILDSFQREWLEIAKDQKDSLIERPIGGQSRDYSLPPNEKISDIFGDAIGAMLILGDAGAGKTFVALELARKLLLHALNDPSQPIPVILNLSSWNRWNWSISDWLIKQIHFQYHIPKGVSSKWIKDSTNSHLLYVFDGLDEVRPDLRKSCLLEIHKFREEYGLSRMIITSRHKEYLTIGAKMMADKAILCKPLSIKQIEEHLPEGLSLGTMRNVLPVDNDQELKKLITPLVLYIMRSIPPEQIKTAKIGSFGEFHHFLFKTYAEQMFEREAVTKRELYNKDDTIKTLSWLGFKMKQNSESDFFIERLQPTWLSDRLQFYTYMMFSRMAVGLAFGASMGMGFCTTVFIFAKAEFETYPLFVCTLIGLVIGLTYTIEGTIRFERTGQTFRAPGKNIRTVFIANIVDLSYYLFGGLVATLLLQWSPFNFLIGALVMAVGRAIFGGRMRKTDAKEDILPVDKIKWWWKTAILSFIICFFSIPIIVLTLEILIEYLFNASLGKSLNRLFCLEGNNWSDWLCIYLVLSLYGGILGGFVRGKFVIEKTLRPNQHVWSSLKNAVTIFLILLSVFLLIGIVYDSPLFYAYSFAGSLGFAFIFGGFSFIQHFALRVVLFRNEYIPWRFAKFLDYAAERIFLKKTGGGYIFIHNLLRDYFASLQNFQSITKDHQLKKGNQ